jgi:hypothetical protein
MRAVLLGCAMKLCGVINVRDIYIYIYIYIYTRVYKPKTPYMLLLHTVADFWNCTCFAMNSYVFLFLSLLLGHVKTF